MHLINDIDLVLGQTRRIGRLVPNITNLIYPIIRSRVDFDDVFKASLSDGLTDIAVIAGLAVLLIRTVHSLGKNLGNTSFPCSTRTREEIGMANFPLLNSLPQGGSYYLLSHQLTKGLTAVLSI